MIYIILALIFYTTAILLITFATRRIDSNLVAAISNTLSAIIPIVIVLPLLHKKVLQNDKVGIVIAVLAGICIALFALALAKSLAVNKVAIVTPLVYGGMIFFSSILSFFFFKEKITMIQGLGLFLVGIGLIFIIYARVSGK